MRRLSNAFAEVLPGDKVDVIGSCIVPVKGPSQTPNGGASNGMTQTRDSQVTRVVYSLQKLEVLAVAQAVVGEEAVGAQNTLRAQDPNGLLNVTRDPQAEMRCAPAPARHHSTKSAESVPEKL